MMINALLTHTIKQWESEASSPGARERAPLVVTPCFGRRESDVTLPSVRSSYFYIWGMYLVLVVYSDATLI